jgi:SulP family sulfate permease
VTRWNPFSPRTLRDDAVAGTVLGVQSVPDGLATGLLAGINPAAGLYGYLIGTGVGAVATGSSFMAVQGTGAMAMVIADVPEISDSSDPTGALAMLTVLTGAFMLIAGVLRLGAVLRFVSNAVLVGFINAVAVNIILGQLGSLTGYDAPGSNRLVRAFNTVTRPDLLDGRTLAIGIATIALIVLLERTRLGAIGMVIAIAATSAVVVAVGWDGVATLTDLGGVPDSLPSLTSPTLRELPALLVPALSLAFVGLVQGAAISANFPEADGTYADASRDFVGQGTANVASGLLQGMPVGGSMSASSINKEAGARSRQSLLIAALTMVVAIVVFGEVIGRIAMPALAGLLMLIGWRTISPGDLLSVWRTGVVQKTVVGVTFVLTMVVPLQYAVLVGVGLSVVLHVVRQSNQVTIRRRVFLDDGGVIEVDPPARLPGAEVVVLQPYGSLFFAAAPVFEAALPSVDASSAGSVVVLRLRGRSDLGTTFMDVLYRYARSLQTVGSKLVIVSANERILEQLDVAGITALIGVDSVYRVEERVGASLARAHDDAVAWIDSQR